MKNLFPKLPDEFVQRHMFLLYLQDLAKNLLLLVDTHQLSHTCLKFNENNKPNDDEELIHWLIINEYHKELNYIYKPHLLFLLLRDFSMYMGDSFRSIENGRVSVAYAIARKPIQDTLFYICWLYVDGDELLNRIQYSDDAKEYDISQFRRDNQDFILRLLDSASKSVYGRINGEYIYNLIYEKSETSLMPIWNKALHIVTTDRKYPTAVGELNFIFADNEIWNDFWSYYYQVMTHICYFAISIVLLSFEEYYEIDKVSVTTNKLILTAKYQKAHGIDLNGYKKAMNKLLEIVHMNCDQCGHEYSKEDLATVFAEHYTFICPKCGKLERVGQYFIGRKQLEEIKEKRIIFLDD